MKEVKLRIKEVRKQAHLTQSELASAIGVSRGAVGLWESLKASELPTLDNLVKMTKVCGTTLNVFAESGSVLPAVELQRGVPVLMWETVTLAHKHPAHMDCTAAYQYVSCPVSHGPGVYALPVVGDSMVSRTNPNQSYPDGCLIYCDPAVPDKVRTGTPVVAMLGGSGEATFKLYLRDGGREWLQPLNHEYEKITTAFEIMSVVIGSFHYADPRALSA